LEPLVNRIPAARRKYQRLCVQAVSLARREARTLA
jgi:hypothetical protein